MTTSEMPNGGLTRTTGRGGRERIVAVGAHEPTRCRRPYAATARWALAAAIVATASTASAAEPPIGGTTSAAEDEPTRLADPGMVIVGASLMGTGAASMTLGGVLMGQAESARNPLLYFAGAGAGFAGIAMLAAGVPVFIIGVRPVPRHEARAAALPTMRIGPASADVSWRF